ncbi:SCP-like protein [Teladorsagia circumcincta]|uniref:SCP-like protein n=1 Tax=Teladorsagia circumcincta TaxID=45464 RepID=A0A2G9U237_TELCI|nr:SCP-like protein [Teladorsagia circumcincta]
MPPLRTASRDTLNLSRRIGISATPNNNVDRGDEFTFERHLQRTDDNYSGNERVDCGTTRYVVNDYGSNDACRSGDNYSGNARINCGATRWVVNRNGINEAGKSDNYSGNERINCGATRRVVNRNGINEAGKSDNYSGNERINCGATRRVVNRNGINEAGKKINQICPTNPDMNDRIRLKAIEMHNYRRSNLANGKVKKNNGNYLPAAANMIRLRYDCELETSARLSVNRCSDSKYPSLPSDVQENIRGVAKSNARYRVNAIELAVKHWWSRVRMVDGIGMAVMYRAKHVSSTISYFTRNPIFTRAGHDKDDDLQMAWATTKFVGCAVSVRQLCGDKWAKNDS